MNSQVQLKESDTHNRNTRGQVFVVKLGFWGLGREWNVWAEQGGQAASLSCADSGLGSAALRSSARGHRVCHVQDYVRWGAGLPFSEKRNADFIQKGWKKANKVWASLDPLCPAFPSPWLQAPFFYPHSPAPELFDWYGNNTWDLLRRYVAVQNAICPFPLPTKTGQPSCRLRTTHPAVLRVFGNGWIPNNFQWVVSDVNAVHPTLFILPQKIKQTYQPTNIFHAFFLLLECVHVVKLIGQTLSTVSLPVCLGRMPGVHASVHPFNNYWTPFVLTK